MVKNIPRVVKLLMFVLPWINCPYLRGLGRIDLKYSIALPLLVLNEDLSHELVPIKASILLVEGQVFITENRGHIFEKR